MRVNSRTVSLLVVGLVCLMSTLVYAASPVEITYLTWLWPERQALLEKTIANFEKENPGIKVKILSTTGWQQNDQKFLTMVAGGVAPDVVHLWFTDAPSFYKKGLALDLTPFIKRDNFNTSIVPPNYETMQLNGKWYGLPRDGGAFSDRALYYNRDLFAQAGLTNPDGTWTWEQFRAIVKKLTVDKDANGKPEQWGFSGGAVRGTDWPIYVWSGGGEIFDEARQAFQLNRPEAVNALQWWANLKLVDGVDRFGGGFETGEAAVMSNAYMYAQQLLTRVKPAFDWSITDFPRGPKGAINVRTTHPLIIPAASAHPEEAWKFIKYTLSDENQYNQVIEWRGFPPQTATIARHPRLLRLNDPPYTYAPFAAVSGKSLPVGVPNWPEIEQRIKQAIGDVFAGKLPVQQAMDAIAPQVEALLRDETESQQ